MSGSALDLVHTAKLVYQGEWRSKPERAIYLLDQAMARAGIDYFASAVDLIGSPRFIVHVRVGDAERARAVIEKVQPRNA